MASFPGAKVHRRSRRQLGRGQSIPTPPLTFVMTSSGDDAILTFSVPVVVRGAIDLHVSGGLNYVSQTVVSPTVIHQTYDAAVATKTWSVTAGDAGAASFQGGVLAAASGTF